MRMSPASVSPPSPGRRAALAGLVAWLNLLGEGGSARRRRARRRRRAVARGEALTRAGDCISCHTARGGPAYAGGRAIETPFGNVYASNLTPDSETGLGRWSADEFWRALHHGRSKSGRLLYPAFPHPNYTRVSRPMPTRCSPTCRACRRWRSRIASTSLSFPFGTQAALAVWRALYFRPTVQPRPGTLAEWNRGAYLVEGLGHCNACHAARNALGATRGTLDLEGGLIPVQNWYAPSLASPHEASVAAWPKQEVIQL